jgi:hypothetical protein
MPRKKAMYTHAPVDNAVHVVLWSEAKQDFWTKELPKSMTDDQVMDYIRKNLKQQPLRIYRGKEIVLRRSRQ